MRGARAVASLLALPIGASVSAPAAADVGERQVLALIRALAYDRQLGERAGDDVLIGVVFGPGEADCAGEALAVLRGLDGVTIQERPIRSMSVSFTDAGALSDALSGGVDVLIVVGGLGEATAEVVRVAHRAGAVTAGFEPEMLTIGVPLVVSDERGELEVYVNLPASRAAGQSFSSKLLQVATVVRENP